MKVKKDIVAAALIKLLTNITNTMPGSAYKFLMGGMSAFTAVKGLDKINLMLNQISDDTGMVDIDLLKNMINTAFNATGGTLTVELFNNAGLLNMLVKPIKLNITKMDIEPILQEIEANAVQSQQTTSSSIKPAQQELQNKNQIQQNNI